MRKWLLVVMTGAIGGAVFLSTACNSDLSPSCGGSNINADEGSPGGTVKCGEGTRLSGNKCVLCKPTDDCPSNSDTPDHASKAPGVTH